MLLCTNFTLFVFKVFETIMYAFICKSAFILPFRVYKMVITSPVLFMYVTYLLQCLFGNAQDQA